MMTPDVERVSAKIYQFPIKRMKLRLAEKQAEVDYCAAALDNCWYHDEAVRQDRKPPRND